jgi:hypothetical protein
MEAIESAKVEKMGCRLHQLYAARGKRLSADNTRREPRNRLCARLELVSRSSFAGIVEYHHGALKPCDYVASKKPVPVLSWPSSESGRDLSKSKLKVNVERPS